MPTHYRNTSDGHNDFDTTIFCQNSSGVRRCGRDRRACAGKQNVKFRWQWKMQAYRHYSHWSHNASSRQTWSRRWFKHKDQGNPCGRFQPKQTGLTLKQVQASSWLYPRFWGLINVDWWKEGEGVNGDWQDRARVELIAAGRRNSSGERSRRTTSKNKTRWNGKVSQNLRDSERFQQPTSGVWLRGRLDWIREHREF